MLGKMSAGRQLLHRLSGSLRLKVTLGLVLPLVLILGTFTAIEHVRHQATEFATLSFLASRIGQVIENSLQHAMLAQDPTALQYILNAISEDKTIRVVYLLDTSGRVVFAPGSEGVGQQLDNRDPTCQPCHRLPPAQRPKSVVVTLPGGQRVFRSMNPIENRPECHRCHDPSQRLNGELLTDISMAPLEKPLADDLRENLLWWGVTILVTVIVANLTMNRLVIYRLRAVANTLARFGQGQLDLRLPTGSPDEIGQLAGAFNDMGQRLQVQESENQSLAQDLRHLAAHRQELLKRLITAQEEERRRVARDLHDGLGQDLAGMAFGLEVVERMGADQPEPTLAHIRRLRVQIAETTNRVYDMILALRPSALDDLGLVPALRVQAERTLKDAGVQFEMEASGFTRRLPPEIETALFRTFQEALHNIARYAGARRVRLSLVAHDGQFEGEIVDDGRGFDPEAIRPNGYTPRGLGLLGMQERVAQCGGTLEILSRPGAGTRLRIRVPLPEVSDD